MAKIKIDNLLLRQKIAQLEKHTNYLEKENKLLRADKSNKLSDNKFHILSLLSKNFNIEEQADLLKEVLHIDEIPLLNILLNRIEALEIQNYNLISKYETLAGSTITYIDEVIEYYEVICDIRNVLNQVFDAQKLTREFMIIRDTLNNKNDYLKKQKDVFLEDKTQLLNNHLREINNEILICKDKLEDFRINSLSSILDEKINKLENIKGDIGKDLLHDNNLLRMNNIRLRNLIQELVSEYCNNLSTNMILKIDSTVNNCFDVILAEDLFYMLNSQAQLIENILN